ncbi:hypothetical protein [Aliihoeflea sp. PC F10.4]
MMAERVSAWRIVWMMAGFLVWAVAFAALYSVLSIGCAFGWDEIAAIGPISLQRVVLIALLLVSLGAGWAVVRVSNAHRKAAGGEGLTLKPFVESAAWLAAWAALASTLFSLGPVLFLTSCY